MATAAECVSLQKRTRDMLDARALGASTSRRRATVDVSGTVDTKTLAVQRPGYLSISLPMRGSSLRIVSGSMSESSGWWPMNISPAP